MKKYIFIHGLPDHSGTWEKLFPLVASLTNEVSFVGLPGISDGIQLNQESTFDEIAKHVASKLPFKNAVLIAHDFGAIIGTMIASMKPDQFSQMILINGPTPHILKRKIETDADQQTRSKYAEKIAKDPKMTLSYNDFIFLKAFLFKNEIGASESYKTSLLNLWKLPVTQINIGTYYRAFLSQVEKDNQFNHPTLQIWSEKDPFIGPAAQEAMQKQFQNHSVFRIDTDSHWPHLSHPDAVFQSIKEFLSNP